MSSSFANVSAPKLEVNELKTEIFSTSTNSVVLEAYDDLCKWYTVTTIKTTSYFILGVWVGSSPRIELPSLRPCFKRLHQINTYDVDDL